MAMWLRQICLVAEDLAKAEDDLASIFGLEVCYRDPAVEKYGLKNFLLPIGNDFLEVVAPFQDGTTAGRYLERRRGDGGYMLIYQNDDGVGFRERVSGEVGIPVIVKRDGDEYRGAQYHPRYCRGTILSVSEVVGETPGQAPYTWPAADGLAWKPHVKQSVTQAIVGAEMQNDDPKEVAELWGRIMERPIAETGPDAYQMSFDNAELRFVKATDGRGDGLGGIDLKINDLDHVHREAAQRNIPVNGDEIIVCGTRIRLIA